MKPLQYFRAQEYYFWQWADNAEVIEIPDGTTICYRRQLNEIILYLGEQGLPPFGSLLLVLIASGHSTKDGLLQISRYFAKYAEMCEEAMDFLDNVSRLPKQYKEGQLKLQLFQVLFNNCHNMISAHNARAIIQSVDDDSLDAEDLLEYTTWSEACVNKDLKTIALLLRKFPTTDDIIKKMSEVIKEVSSSLEVTVSDIEDVFEPKTFVDKLIQDGRTFQVGTLIKPLWAGFTIPINTATPSQQQFGGVSDLSNKGDFDKLLLSEFANDDLTFLSRLANNEALYLHREIPPFTDNQQRIFLTDISLYSWGTPKILNIASCIAITQHPKAKNINSLFAVGDEYFPLDFSDIEGVIKALAYTDSSLAPSNGIEIALKEQIQSTSTEITVLLSEDSLSNYKTQKVLNEYQQWIKYVITTNKEGFICFYRYKSGTKKLVQQIHLDLEKIWRKQPVKASETFKKSTVIEEFDFPVLFAHPMYAEIIYKEEKDYYCVANRRLFKQHWYNKTSRGFSVVYKDLPPTAKCCIGIDENGDTLFLYFNPENKELAIVNLQNATRLTTILTQWKNNNSGFFFFNYVFYNLGNTDGIKVLVYENKIHTERITFERTSLVWDSHRQFTEWIEGLNKNQISKPILKNVSRLYINIADNIVFNQHELREYSGNINIAKNDFLEKVKAIRIKNTKTFEFPDKSSITIHSSGIAILRSSHYDIPDIYVPLVVNSTVAIATEDYIAGNDYYFPVHKRFNNQQQKKISTQKFFNDYLKCYIDHIITSCS